VHGAGLAEFHSFLFEGSSCRGGRSVDSLRAAAPAYPSPLWLEESSSLGSGGIFERGTGDGTELFPTLSESRPIGSESGLVATSLFRVSARPRNPIAIKIAPPIISQCGNSIDETKPIYFPFGFSRWRAANREMLFKRVVLLWMRKARASTARRRALFSNRKGIMRFHRRGR
jgi:hypothetical protein